MNEHILHLTDGTTISAKVNFATLYYMEKYHVPDLIKDANEKAGDDDAMEATARMLHILLLSNGRNCSFNEALVLCPIDIDEVSGVFEDFRVRLEEFKKKQEAKQATREFLNQV